MYSSLRETYIEDLPAAEVNQIAIKCWQIQLYYAQHCCFATTTLLKNIKTYYVILFRIIPSASN